MTPMSSENLSPQASVGRLTTRRPLRCLKSPQESRGQLNTRVLRATTYRYRRANPKKDPFTHSGCPSPLVRHDHILVTRRRHRFADPLFFASCSQGPGSGRMHSTNLDFQRNLTTLPLPLFCNPVTLHQYRNLHLQGSKGETPIQYQVRSAPTTQSPRLGLCFPIDRPSFHRLPILSVVSPRRAPAIQIPLLYIPTFATCSFLTVLLRYSPLTLVRVTSTSSITKT